MRACALPLVDSALDAFIDGRASVATPAYGPLEGALPLELGSGAGEFRNALIRRFQWHESPTR